VAQFAPDLQVVLGRGQKEREKWQGEGSRLGTLTLEPPPLPPLMNSLILLALPLHGGRAGGFSRRARVQGLASGLPGRLGFFLDHVLPLIDRGLKLGPEQKELA
jgi:hypothetical protein